MATTTRPPVYDLALHEATAREALSSQTDEEIMESTSQATQRKITVESFDVVRVARPEVVCFNELLILYPPPSLEGDLARVTPDNMVVVNPGPADERQSYNILFEPAGPVMVLEYVSRGNRRKDYVINRRKYEQDLKVPYYLLFEPRTQALSVLKLAPRSKKYGPVRRNAAGRLPVPDLELEVGLLDGWVRYWFRGKLVALPAELVEQVGAARRQAAAAEERATAAEAELAALRAEVARLRGPSPG